jgi:hypothetical protein
MPSFGIFTDIIKDKYSKINIFNTKKVFTSDLNIKYIETKIPILIIIESNKMNIINLDG